MTGDLERHDLDVIRNDGAEVVEITTDQAAKLIDLLPDEFYDDLVQALDEARASGLGDGKTGYVVIKISEG